MERRLPLTAKQYRIVIEALGMLDESIRSDYLGLGPVRQAERLGLLVEARQIVDEAYGDYQGPGR